jgi:hypothetical protein
VSKETIYRVSFISQGEVYEVYARNVSQGGLFGFIEIEELVFGERSKLLIDSSEERLKTEFEGVRRTYVPLHSVHHRLSVVLTVFITSAPDMCT